MPAPQLSLLSPAEHAYIYTSLTARPPLRPDGRTSTTFRPLIAETDLLPFTNGSARLCFADGAEAIVGVKAELEKTVDASHVPTAAADASHSNDRNIRPHGKSHWVEVTIDVPGQQSRDEDNTAIATFAQMIHDALNAEGALCGLLVINASWHWRLYIDIILISLLPGSFPLPILSLTTHLALLSTRIPSLTSEKDEDPLFNDDWDTAAFLYPRSTASLDSTQPLASMKPPIHLLIASAGSNIFFDPSKEELAVADFVLATTLSQSTLPTSTTTSNADQSTLQIQGMRTLDPPLRTTDPTSAALGGEPNAFEISAMAPNASRDGAQSGAAEGVWRPRRGGVKRAVVAEMIKLCLKPGGPGEEAFSGLEGFLKQADHSEAVDSDMSE